MNFDYVIDSDAKFLAWKGMTSGCEKVLIRKGTWTLASGGIPLSTTGTKVVVGESGSLLVFSASTQGLYYYMNPKTLDYNMNGVTCSVINLAGYSSVSGFSYCPNLTNCSGSVNAGVNGSATGFLICTNLTNCSGSGNASGNASGIGIAYGFLTCTILTNCSGSASTGTSGLGYGFNGCKKMQQNSHGTCTTAAYYISYADSASANACADTAAGGYNS
jgi:hypothetical protein